MNMDIHKYQSSTLGTPSLGIVLLLHETLNNTHRWIYTLDVLSSHHQLRLRFKDKNRSSLSSVQTQREYRLSLLRSDPNIHSKSSTSNAQHCHSHSKISPVAGV